MPKNGRGARRGLLGPDKGVGSASARLTWRSLITSPGPATSLGCWAGSALLGVSAAIHLHLWSNGYDRIPTIGPLFLVQGIVGMVMAALLAISRHFLVALAGALFAVGIRIHRDAGRRLGRPPPGLRAGHTGQHPFPLWLSVRS
ncbi:MAG TPA: hypothetical protein VMV06_10100 [Acidimicrobiales bacterium]|nr:hypothetical protein [Acidimicrobiales bacterium]